MKQFFNIIVFLGLLFFPILTNAQPPLGAEMQNLEVFHTPEVFPELLIDSTDGTKYFLSDFSDRIVLLNLWATWCPPCIEELPSLDRLQTAIGDEYFKVAAVSLDDGMTPKQIGDFLKEHSAENLEPMLDAESSTSEIPNLAGLPTTYILDENGNMLARFEGDADWSTPEAQKIIQYYIDRMNEKYGL